MTIEKTVKNICGFRGKVPRPHFLLPEVVEEIEQMLGYDNLPYFFSKNNISQVKKAKKFYSQILTNENEWIHNKFVTCIRDPVGRSLSTLLYASPDILSDLYEISEENGFIIPDERKFLEVVSSFYWKVAKECPKYDNFDDLSDHFMSFHLRRQQHFFDHCLRRVTGVDIYRRPFDHDRGYGIYYGKKSSILVLKFERIGEVLVPALQEFFHSGIGCDVDSNNGTVWIGRKLKQRFMKRVKIPQSFADYCYKSRYIKHFYTEEEIAAYKEKYNVI